MVGLVAISSCANHVHYWAAILIGIISGAGYIAARYGNSGAIKILISQHTEVIEFVFLLRVMH